MQPAGRVCDAAALKHTFTNAPAARTRSLADESGDQYTRSDMQPPCTLGPTPAAHYILSLSGSQLQWRGQLVARHPLKNRDSLLGSVEKLTTRSLRCLLLFFQAGFFSGAAGFFALGVCAAAGLGRCGCFIKLASARQSAQTNAQKVLQFLL